MTPKHEIFKDIITKKPADNQPMPENLIKNEPDIEEVFFERTIGVYPQEAIIPISSDKSFNILFRSLLGTIISREYFSNTTSISKIEIEFDDSSFHSNINFPNTFQYSLGYMSENGVLLASQAYEAGIDDFVTDLKKSRLCFRAFRSETQWESVLPSIEVPECLCVSSYCIVYTSLNYLRFFSLGGIQNIVISMSGPVVTMTSYDSELAILYHSAAPVLGCQSITGELWHLGELGINSEAEYFKEDFKVAISPDEKIV